MYFASVCRSTVATSGARMALVTQRQGRVSPDTPRHSAVGAWCCGIFPMKTSVYVGGLDEAVSEELVLAAFVPFGDIKSVQIARDYSSSKSKGYAFVEFELEEDALDAIENMDGAEIMGRTISCAQTKPRLAVNPGKAIWTTEEFSAQTAAEPDADSEQQQQ